MTRTRVSSNISSPISVEVQRSVLNASTQVWGAPYKYWGSILTPESTTKTITDTVTPDFKKRSARGEIINNPLLMSYVNEYQNLGSYSYDYRLRSKVNPQLLNAGVYDFGLVPGTYPVIKLSTGYGAYLDAPVLSDAGIQNLKDVAITRAFANISTADTLALVTALEMGKTLTSLGSILKRVTKLYRFIIRERRKIEKLRNVLSARKIATMVADLWMEARYSLRPLYYDIIGTFKALDRPLEKATDRRTFRGKEKYEDFVEQTDIVPLSDSGHTGSYFTVDRRTDVSYVARAGCLCKISAETRAHSLGLYEIPASLWEIVKLSFLVDWIFNVGDFISAYTPRLGANVLASWVTVEKTVTQSVYCSPPINGTPTDFSTSVSEGAGFNWNAGIKVKTTVDTERFVDVSRPVIPSWNVNLSPSKLIDLGIIISNFKRSDASLRKLRL